ncbi:hypothetical protein [Winogradskyella forsetii]|uniref:hypothetical protein n=1 Tax=Winogradskyella forsetii TaxID=2686077 RepID=UPI0015BB6321|nr:hypothetical protein [Winogradskyella forsetii]
MAGLILIAFVIVGGFSFVILRLSVSCMFWSAKTSEDRIKVFKLYFPYYIICLFTLCILAIIGLDRSIFAIYYFSSVFFISLFIWSRKIKYSSRFKKNLNKTLEPQQPELP